MGFTNVAWESRSTEVLAGDLADGPGPMSIGQAGASWVRVADELSSVSDDYNRVVDRIRSAFTSQGADAAAGKLDQYGQWLAAAAADAAGNGERAEQAAVAYSVAVLAMPSVAEAVQARTTRDVMASLSAYNGAVLVGHFAEFDEAVTTSQGDAAAVMYKYEEACTDVTVAWDQPPPPDVCTSAALQAEHASIAGDSGAGAEGGGLSQGSGSVSAPPVAPAPLSPFRAVGAASTAGPKQLTKAAAVNGATGSAAAGPLGTGYGPMALARGAAGREHQSSITAGTLDGVGEPGASLSATDTPWLPDAAPGDAAFVVTAVSWGPSTSAFDDLAVADEPDVPGYAERAGPTLEQVSHRWVSPPVIGADKGSVL